MKSLVLNKQVPDFILANKNSKHRDLLTLKLRYGIGFCWFSVFPFRLLQNGRHFGRVLQVFTVFVLGLF